MYVTLYLLLLDAAGHLGCFDVLNSYSKFLRSLLEVRVEPYGMYLSIGYTSLVRNDVHGQNWWMGACVGFVCGVWCYYKQIIC